MENKEEEEIVSVKLYRNDCMVVLKELPTESIDLVVTDPPYKLVQGGCTNHAVKLKGAEIQDLKSGQVFNNNIIKFSEWIPEIYRVLKQQTHCYIMCNDRNLQEVLNVGTKAGFKLLNVLVWGKSKHSPNRYYLKNCEFIVMFRKGKAKNINEMGTKQLLQIPNVENKSHPSEKPVELISILIRNSSNEGETVLDPFMGSNSCGEACKELKRNFIGIELEKKYYRIAVERVKKKS